jgi:prolyl-tRNA editing enzyme YbaK/EbsC (Cys-tRNA(Pro) deacylase)
VSSDSPGVSSDVEPNELHHRARRVVDHAAERGVTIEVIEYPNEGARTAEEAAASVGCLVDQIVKSMIFAAGEDRELVLALTAGANKVSGSSLARVAGVDACHRATVDEVREATGYAIGGVPPFGHNRPLRTWVDPHLLTFDRVWAAAGTPRHVFGISPHDLVALTGAEPANFTE